MAKVLFTLGVNPDTPLDDGQTALMWAAKYANEWMTLFLLNKHADPNKRDEHGKTALIHAVIPRNVRAATLEIVPLLAAADANFDIKDAVYEQTALMWALGTYLPDRRLIAMLLSYGPDLTLKDTKGRTALIIAAQHGNTEAVRVMLHPEIRDRMIEDILWEKKVNSDITRYCIAPFLRKQDQRFIDLQDNDGRSALMFASHHGYVDIVQLLVDAGVDTMLIDKDGHDAHYFAIHSSDSNFLDQARICSILGIAVANQCEIQ